MKNIKMIFIVTSVFAMIMFFFPYIVEATTATEAIGKIKADTTGDSKGKIAEVVNNVLGFLQVASALIAVVMIAATGFRYIIETPEVKSELKKNMIPIIVGIILVFFAASITKFFIGMFSEGKKSYYEGGGYWQVYDEDTDTYVRKHESELNQ